MVRRQNYPTNFEQNTPKKGFFKNKMCHKDGVKSVSWYYLCTHKQKTVFRRNGKRIEGAHAP